MLSQQIWLKVNQDTRKKIAEIFQIPRSGSTEVLNTRMGQSIVTSDGYNYTDLEALTLQKLQDYMKTAETDFYKIFGELVKLLEGTVTVEKPKVEEEKQEIINQPKKTYGKRKRKGN